MKIVKVVLKVLHVGILLSLNNLPLSLQAENDGLVLSRFEAPLKNDWRGKTETSSGFIEETVSDYVYEGQSSGKWVPSIDFSIHLRNCPENWSQYHILSVWIYAENAIGQVINWQFVSPGINGDSDYYLRQLKVNWEGWKEVEIELQKLGVAREPRGLNHITQFIISSKGWDVEEPLPDAVLYFDDMRLR